MRIIKRMFASILTIAIALGDCGSMAVFAEETAVVSENSVSENTVSENSELENAASENPESENTATENSDSEINLPALHIGQIPNGKKLPTAEDNTFAYDLPISFASEKHLVLFTNYDIEAISEVDTLEWSILRGKKGAPIGSACLLNEEDDWHGFETVTSSPYFTMEKITDTESAYSQMMALVFREPSLIADTIGRGETDELSETYDYYIRASYYPVTENGKAETFYAAATIPFVPQIKASADDLPDAEVISENNLPDETSVSENNADPVEEELSKETPDVTLPDEETEKMPVTENTEAAQTTQETATLSENNTTPEPSTPSDPSQTNGSVIRISLDDTEVTAPIQMQTGQTKTLTAVTVPASALPISWDSSDDAVATVNGSGLITAKAEGYAKIIASCGDTTAFVSVDVVTDEAGNKLLDLSKDPARAIRVAGFQQDSEDFVYSGQKITQDHLRVYHGEILLQEKTDYTISYKNNINAGTYNSAKAPSLTIKLKGQYQGSVTLYYTIRPRDINEIDRSETVESGSKTSLLPGYEQAVNYAAKITIPKPVFTFGKKTLALNKDFVCNYATAPENATPLPADYKKGDSYEPGKVYTYMVEGIGNFTGSVPMQVVVTKDKNLNFSSASATLSQKKYAYQGKPLQKSDVVIDQVTLNRQVLEKSLYDYEVCANEIDGAYIMITPTSAGKNKGYCGCKRINLKLFGDRKITEAAPSTNWKASLLFSQKELNKTGGMFQEKTNLLKFGSDTLVEGVDYTLKYSNAKKVGTATATFTGTGRYTGSLKLKYTITPNYEDKNLRILWGENVIESGEKGENLSVVYQKGGAFPDLTIKDQDSVVLTYKTDYTITCKDNKTPNQSMTCEITGKGNYKGYRKTVSLKVLPGNLSKAVMTVSDKPYSTKNNAWKSTVKITDVNGKPLSAGKDYDKLLVYSHNQEQSPKDGTVITVTANGIDCYAGSSITGSYRIYQNSISKLKIVIDPQEYTGEAITLKPGDIHLYASSADQKNKVELPNKESCYEIITSTYKNNTKSGTAKVTLRGLGSYGGTKTCSFKINKKKYLINHIKSITLNKNSIAFTLAERNNDTQEAVEKRTLTATITAETNERINNPTVVWTSSNQAIASVTAIETSTGRSATTATSSALIELKKAGSVTLTAISQDGNKKAQCKITIVDAPLLQESGQTLKGAVGDTHTLHLQFSGTQANLNDIVWESSNTDVATVEKDPNTSGQTATARLTLKKVGAAVISVYSNNRKYVQQCYAVVIGNETPPSGDKILIYEQKSGCTDDTPYINKILRDWEAWEKPEYNSPNKGKYEAMYIPAGVYHIDITSEGIDSFGKGKFGGIVLTENQKLIMSPSALLMALPTGSTKPTQVIYAFGRENVTISGGQIVGERKTHTGSTSTYDGHGIRIAGCTNVTIENVDVSQCWGDGIWLGLHSTKAPCDGVTITNCNLHHNRRNNLSITDASNITVEGSAFHYASGIAPQYGIDIEPGESGYTCRNVRISNSTFKGNAVGTIQILGQKNAHINGVTIENCKGDKAPVKWSGFGGSVSGVTENNNNWNWK